jgi:hypothetical protein
MFHDAFAVELGRAGAPIDEVSLSLGRSSVKLTEHSAQARRMDAAWTRPGHDPDTTRMRRREHSVSPSRFGVTTC